MGVIRIVGGEKKGHKVRVPPGQKVRPMSEKAREAVFAIIGPDVLGKPVWDLFAGSGALGLEALSRGAARALFVEKDPAVARTLRENVNRLGFSERAKVLRADVFRWIDRPDIWPEEPTLVFVAPPYALYGRDMPRVAGLWNKLARRLPRGSILVFQLDRAVDPRSLPGGVEWDLRTYGQVRNAIGWIDEMPSTGEGAARAEETPAPFPDPPTSS